MTRLRVSPFPPRTDPETTISREFTLPTARTFTLSGTASLSALIPDDQIDRLVGRSRRRPTGCATPTRRAASTATSGHGAATRRRQPGHGLAARVRAAPRPASGCSTTWPRHTRFAGLTLQVVADGRHSVPTAMTVTPGSQVRTVALPPIADSSVPGAVTTVPVHFPALTGALGSPSPRVRPEYAANYYSAGPLALPLGIADIGIPGVQAPPTPANLPGTCLSNLLSIDGQPITSRRRLDPERPRQRRGADRALRARRQRHHPRRRPARRADGASDTTRRARARRRTCTGWNIDQLVLDSAAGRRPGPAASPTTAGRRTAGHPARRGAHRRHDLHIVSHERPVSGARQPFELVLGQSINKGWQAVADPGPRPPPGSHSVDLGPPQLVDSFANGWPVTAADLQRLGGSDFTVSLPGRPNARSGPPWPSRGDAAPLPGPRLPAGARPALAAGAAAAPPARAGRARRAGRAGHRALRRARPGHALLAAAQGRAPARLAALPARPGHRRRHRRRSPPCRVAHRGRPRRGARVGDARALVPWARAVATVGGVAFIVAGCINVVQGQNVHHYLPGSNWAGSFVHAGNLIWLGVVLLLADAVDLGPRAAGQEAAGPARSGPVTRRQGRRHQAGAADRRHRRLTGSAAAGAQRRSGPTPPPPTPPGRAGGGVPGEPAGPGQRALGQAAAQHLVAQHPPQRAAPARPTSSTSRPDSPSTTASAWPAMSVATAGVPQAAASVSVMPQPSRCELLATTQARRYHDTSSSSLDLARQRDPVGRRRARRGSASSAGRS